MQKCMGSPKVVSNSTASRCWSEDNPLPVIRFKIINMTIAGKTNSKQDAEFTFLFFKRFYTKNGWAKHQINMQR